MAEAGSKYETKRENGLSHFLEHMCFKGTANRPAASQISTELDGLGVENNAFTGQEFTGYYAKAEAKHFPKLLDILSDLYLNPLFDEEEIRKEKGVIQDEINMYEDLPMRRAGEYFMELLYGDQPAGWSIAGPKELVSTFTRDMFLDYRKRNYVAKATKVIVAGNVSATKTLAMLEKAFAHTPQAKKDKKLKVIESQSKPKVFLKEKESDQTHLVMGFRTVPLTHKDYAPLQVLAGVLGSGMSSRLFRKVRDELGVGYYVRAEQDAYTDHGYLVASAGVAHHRIDEVIDAILEEFRKLRDEQVSKEELIKTKEHLTGRLYLGLEGTDALAELYGFQEVLLKKLRTPDDMAARIRKVTAKDIQAVAKKYFVDKGLNLVLIGPYKDQARFVSKLKMPKAK